jgi:hypothetical protein
VRAVRVENLSDSAAISVPVNVDIDDLMTLSHFRLVLSQMGSFHRPPLKSAEHVYHAPTMNALRIDLSRAFGPGECGEVPIGDPGSFECFDGDLRLLRAVDDRNDPIRQVPQGVCILVRLHMACEINLECQRKNRTLYRS